MKPILDIPSLSIPNSPERYQVWKPGWDVVLPGGHTRQFDPYRYSSDLTIFNSFLNSAVAEYNIVQAVNVKRDLVPPQYSIGSFREYKLEIHYDYDLIYAYRIGTTFGRPTLVIAEIIEFILMKNKINNFPEFYETMHRGYGDIVGRHVQFYDEKRWYTLRGKWAECKQLETMLDIIAGLEAETN